MSTKLMRTDNLVRCLAVAFMAATSASCGDVVTSSDAPVLMLVNSLAVTGTSSNVMTSDVLPAAADSATAILTAVMKDATVTGPSTNNRISITRYRVQYRRADGLNTPGVDVPHPFDGAASITFVPLTTGTLVFEIVRAVAKQETPLLQLRNTRNVISTIADVTFYGTDAVGNDVSATASMLIDFGDN